MTETVHASCVAIPHDGRLRGVLLLGGSGAGKSDLALRLIDRGARLVSDDYTILAARDGRLVATAPERIAGLIEVRGIGIVARDWLHETEIGLALDLGRAPDRMPEGELRMTFAGLAVLAIGFAPFEPSAALKAELAAAQFWRSAA